MFTFKKIFNNIVLTAKFNEKWFYFIPRYINCTDWKNDFEKLGHFLEKLKSANFCLIGDLNARIFEEQVLDSEVLIDLPYICNTRSSRDKTLNTK